MQRKKILLSVGIAIALGISAKFLIFKNTSQKLTANCETARPKGYRSAYCGCSARYNDCQLEHSLPPDGVLKDTPSDNAGSPRGCDTDICEAPAVVVLHGLVRSSASMNKISQALNKAGYTVCNIQYPSRKYSIERLAVDSVYSEISKCVPNLEQEINFVTHSMGGIIVRQLANSTDIAIDRVVMLSPPNQGSELVDKLKVIPLFKFINGEAGLSLGTEANSVPNSLGRVDFEAGIIIGDRSYNPLYSYLIEGADDGKVSVDRARIEGMKDFLIVPFSHSFIMNSDTVIEQTISFLKSGKFQ